jgi:ABC-type cobalamin transport system permease subunit
MKRSRAYKTYPTWRQRDSRMLLISVVVGLIAAAFMGVAIYFSNRGYH